MRRAARIELSPEERADLTALVQARTTPQRVAFRARIVLLASAGRTNRAIADELGTSPGTVRRWRQRFRGERVPSVEHDAPRPGRPPKLSGATVAEIVRATRESRPPGGRAWTTRSLARAFGVSRSTVHRVWRSQRLGPDDRLRPAPDRSTGFIDRISDFVGLYVDPPERAMVFLVDSRPAGVGGPSAGRAERPVERRDRSAQFLRFLRSVERESPPEFDLHLVVDQLWTSAVPSVQRWLARHPRVVLHFLPGGAPGANPLDRWVTELAAKRIGPGSAGSVVRLNRAIRTEPGGPPGSARPFVWTATSREIRRRVRSSPIR